MIDFVRQYFFKKINGIKLAIYIIGMFWIKFIVIMMFFCLCYRIFIRKLGQLREDFYLQTSVVTKIVAITTSFFIISVYFLRDSVVLLLILGVFLIFVADFYEYIVTKSITRDFSNQRISLINSILLGLSAGTSIRETINSNVNLLNPVLFRQIQAVWLENMGKNNLKDITAEVFEFANLLKSVENNHFSARSLLFNERNRLQIRKNIKQKSGQALAQIHAQMLVMTVLYILILMFLVHRFDLAKIWQFILWSVSLYFVGIISIWYLQGSFKWKN